MSAWAFVQKVATELFNEAKEKTFEENGTVNGGEAIGFDHHIQFRNNVVAVLACCWYFYSTAGQPPQVQDLKIRPLVLFLHSLAFLTCVNFPELFHVKSLFTFLTACFHLTQKTEIKTFWLGLFLTIRFSFSSRVERRSGLWFPYPPSPSSLEPS